MRKVYLTAALLVIFWLTASWGYAWTHGARSRRDVGEAAFSIAALLVGLGRFFRPWRASVRHHKAVAASRQFAVILLAVGGACGLASAVVWLL